METLQRKLACDTCGTSDLSVMIGHGDLGWSDQEWVQLVFLCSFMHRTEVRVKRAF